MNLWVRITASSIQAQAHNQELLYWTQTDDRDTGADSVENTPTKGQGLKSEAVEVVLDIYMCVCVFTVLV